jgi:hypothetical protein
MEQVMAVVKNKGDFGPCVEVACPHCGTVSVIHTKNLPQYAPKVVHCETDDGGCDQPFMVRGEILAAPVRLQIGLSLSDFYTLKRMPSAPNPAGRVEGQAITNPQEIEAAMADTEGWDAS